MDSPPATNPLKDTPISNSAKTNKISNLISIHRPNLEKDYIPLYKHLHSNPELSNLESSTAATIVQHLKSISPSITIHSGIGGHGIAAVLKSSNPEGGKTVLLRADMDALPILETTGLGYASKKTMRNEEGIPKPVMHACGHDMHVTTLLAATALLDSCKHDWTGTLLLVFQPAEEKGSGAKSMVEDGLYNMIPTPDIVLGGHVLPHRAGTIGTKRGLMATAADSLVVTLHGKGGHASQPHHLVDPIIMAANTILRLQTIVSREVDPADSVVVTCGSVIAGDAENVVPDTATLKLNVRTVKKETREKVLASVERIVRAECWASGAVKEPEIVRTGGFPFTVNDEEVTGRLEETFAAHFGVGKHGYDADVDRLAGSEDFGILASAINKPSSFWVYGGTDPDLWDKAEKDGRLGSDIPINHSSIFAPVIMPTLQTGMDAYAVAALTWLVNDD